MATLCGLTGWGCHAAAARWGVPLALIEVGRSMPKGVYVFRHLAPARVGEVVVEMHPAGFAQPWLMKRVAATAGSLFCWREAKGTHEIDGRRMPPPHPLARTVGLEPWRGCRKIEAGELVGYGQSPDSFDSRYRGPVREAQVAAVYGLALPLGWLIDDGAAPDRGADEAHLLGAEGVGGGGKTLADLRREGEGAHGGPAGR